MISDFSITPLGGVKQIGSNMNLVTIDNIHNILIDSGILFPHDDFFGINYLIPNYEHINIPNSVYF